LSLKKILLISKFKSKNSKKNFVIESNLICYF
jgi:hypothetical protein